MSVTKKLAVLIDADNISADAIEYLLLEINKFGIASVKRIYGDWTDNKLNKWKNVLLKFGINPIQQFAYTSGKNATDMAMAIDAMDLLYSNTFDGFCLVSSDSDFTRLASRIRENGLEVLGFGAQKTPEAFVQACDKFTHIELLMPIKDVTQETIAKNDPIITNPIYETAIQTPTLSNTVKPVTTEPIKKIIATPTPSNPQYANPNTIKPLIKKAIDAQANDNGWAKLGAIGSYLNQVKPDFDVRQFGHEKLSGLIKALHKDFELQLEGSVFTVKYKASVQLSPAVKKWSAEELNADSSLINTISQHIAKLSKTDGWALFNEVIKSIGKDFFIKYGYAKTSDLFAELKNIELKTQNNQLFVKKYWGASRIITFIKKILSEHQSQDGWIPIDNLVKQLQTQSLFKFQILGFHNTIDLIENIRPEIYEFKITDDQKYIRLLTTQKANQSIQIIDNILKKHGNQGGWLSIKVLIQLLPNNMQDEAWLTKQLMTSDSRLYQLSHQENELHVRLYSPTPPNLDSIKKPQAMSTVFQPNITNPDAILIKTKELINTTIDQISDENGLAHFNQLITILEKEIDMTPFHVSISRIIYFISETNNECYTTMFFSKGGLHIKHTR